MLGKEDSFKSRKNAIVALTYIPRVEKRRTRKQQYFKIYKYI